ncbi:hypothetical protein MASR1M32_15040 [Rhodobacter sp.]
MLPALDSRRRGCPCRLPAARDRRRRSCPLALELAQWGSEDLPFLTPPAPGPLAEAKALLTDLGALEAGRITAHGRALAALPLHPRIGHMLAVAGPGAAPLAALLEERDPLRGAAPDLLQRLKAIDLPPAEAHRPTIERIRTEARRLARVAPRGNRPDLTPAQQAALAYPDRIGLRRKGDAPRYLLSGGKGAILPGGPLTAARMIVATDLDGDPREATIRQAIALPEAEFRALCADRIHWRDSVEWNRREGRVAARRHEVFGALVLDDRPRPQAPVEALAAAALEGLRLTGLPWLPSARRLRARIALAGEEGWPDVTDAALLDTAEDWLLPYLAKARTEADLRALDLTPALKAMLTWDQQARLDRLTPAGFVTPLGRHVPIDYDGDHPGIEVRLQEMFGVTVHPTVGAHRLPLRITLLSPAQRPVQVTLDLPGFWAKSYADVRKDMRGQYPRHPWPEDPTVAEPTLRAKPRGT